MSEYSPDPQLIFRMVPGAGERQRHSVTGMWRFVCALCEWRSTERDTPEEVDTIAAAHLENVHGASYVVKTP